MSAPTEPGQSRVKKFLAAAVAFSLVAIVAGAQILPRGTVEVSYPRVSAIGCNSHLFADGDGWIGNEGRTTGDPIEGTFSFSGNRGKLVQPDGNEVSFRRWTKPHFMPCIADTIN